MIRRTSHRAAVAEPHLHKWGICPRDPRIPIHSPTTSRQNLPTLRKVHYLMRSVTRQYLGFPGETMARPIVLRPQTHVPHVLRLALVIPRQCLAPGRGGLLVEPY